MILSAQTHANTWKCLYTHIYVLEHTASHTHTHTPAHTLGMAARLGQVLAISQRINHPTLNNLRVVLTV